MGVLRSRACEARPSGLLAAQIPGHVRNPVPVGWRRSADGATVAGAFRYGIDDEVFEAVTQPAGEREGQ
jgi:hypothetical protein